MFLNATLTPTWVVNKSVVVTDYKRKRSQDFLTITEIWIKIYLYDHQPSFYSAGVGLGCYVEGIVKS